MDRRLLVLVPALGLVALGACKKDERATAGRPQRASEAMPPAETIARLAAIEAAALTGDQEGIRRNMGAMQDDFRRSIRLADPARAVDREAARQAVRSVQGVRSVAWVDRENLFVILNSNQARNYDTIDRICLTLEPLGDTLGVIVNLQSGVANNGDELAILSRNCQLNPGERALLSRSRSLDTIDPDARRQHKASQELSAQDAEDRARQEENLRILEESTPSVHD